MFDQSFGLFRGTYVIRTSAKVQYSVFNPLSKVLQNADSISFITVPVQMGERSHVLGHHGNPLQRTCQPICQTKAHRYNSVTDILDKQTLNITENMSVIAILPVFILRNIKKRNKH